LESFYGTDESDAISVATLHKDLRWSDYEYDDILDHAENGGWLEKGNTLHLEMNLIPKDSGLDCFVNYRSEFLT